MSVNSRLKAISIIGQRKAFYRQRIPGSSCERKETVDIDVLITSSNGDKKIKTDRPPLRIWKWTPSYFPTLFNFSHHFLPLCC